MDRSSIIQLIVMISGNSEIGLTTPVNGYMKFQKVPINIKNARLTPTENRIKELHERMRNSRLHSSKRRKYWK